MYTYILKANLFIYLVPNEIIKRFAEAFSIPASFLEVAGSILHLEPVAATEVCPEFLSPS
jgi:hypothetical protein